MVTITGKEIRILKQGGLDKEMTEVDGIKRHVELEIDGKLLVGDVVLTDTIRAWYDSKLHLNSGLNRCILHVARRDVWTNLRMRLQSGKAIDTVLGSIVFDKC